MIARTPKLGIAALTFALFFSAFSESLRGQDGGRSLRILIDASKDGGLWWFPQAGSYNPDEHHQGTRIASRLKDRGWHVTELGRGHTITESTLSGYDVILIIHPFFHYRDSEQRAYVRAVEDGARLLLLGPGRNSGVHAAFGFKFPASRFGSADSWVKHPLNLQIEDLEVLWTPGLTARREAVPLASIGEGTRKLPIVTYLPAASGNGGGVLYVGHSDVMSAVPSIQEHLVETISILGYGPIETPDPSAVSFRTRASHLGAPKLVSPLPGELLPQPAEGPWGFDWDDVPGAVEYELVVSGPNASVPLTRVLVSVSEFRPKPLHLASESNVQKPYIADHNLRNWIWRVRARGEDGVWGPWSTAGRFNVQPVEP